MLAITRMKTIKLARAFALLFLIFLVAIATDTAQAQSKSVVVARRDGDVTIRSNGDMDFVETWQVNFIGGPFRFAFRGIPLDRLEGITNLGVTEGGPVFRA